jgi:hypothetical protein
MEIHVIDTEQYIIRLDNRMPFHFGNVTLDRAVRTLVAVTVEVDGERKTGLSMGTSGSAWFLKDPTLSLPELVESFVEVTTAACEHAEAIDGASTVFDLWQNSFERQREWAEDTDHPPLLWEYGVSLVEQAVIDAFCRLTGTRFHDAVRDGSLGLELDAFYDELADREPADLLPTNPLRSVAIRHTVGLTDPLTVEDLSAEDRLDDGLPQTMVEYIEEQGVSHFKIKLSADLDADRNRLRRIASVISETDLADYAFTVDANEQYPSAEEFRRQWEEIAADAALADFLDNLLYVEQPLPRDAAFTEETEQTFTEWAGPPIIIDESDDRPDRLTTALDCGYAGTSHKNCKGVFKGVANRCLIEYRRRTNPEGTYVMSGEDLTTLGPVELQEDLAVMASLGMDHVERNGHHYFTGLSMFSSDIQKAVLEAHGDLYRHHERGFATLDIWDGDISLASVVEAPFGHAVDIDRSQFTPVSEWSPSSLVD